MAARLGIETTIHKLRHYSATELIMAGVNPRTVAGRLGHGGGGTTTLKVYTAWVSEADQRAATGIGASMPYRPGAVDPEKQRRAAPRYPYEVIAADIGRCIDAGSLNPAAEIPSAAELAGEHDVSLATAKRALVLAQEWGLLERIDRNTLRVVAPLPACDGPAVPPAPTVPHRGNRTMLTFAVRHRGEQVTRFSAVVDPVDGEAMEQLLRAAVLRAGGTVDTVAEYEMDVARPGDPELLMTMVAAPSR